MAKTTVLLRQPYDGLEDKISLETGLSCPEPTLAQQNMAEQCDINTIVNQFLKTGDLPVVPDNFPRYGDFSDAKDYHTSLNLVLEAQESFMQLPATLRARFNNDPAQLLDFLNDDSNRAEAVKLGLIDEKSAPEAAPQHASAPERVQPAQADAGGTKEGA